MSWVLLWSTLLMGFIGSLHCGLMCGPISCNIKNKKLMWSYHLGRLFSYTMLAVLLHFGFRYLLKIESRSLKVLVTFLFLILFGLFSLVQMGWLRMPALQKIQFRLIWSARRWLANSPALFGLMTGLFPCGWLHTFIFFSSQMSTLKDSLILVFIFWLCSLPVLITVNHTFQVVLRRTPTRYQQVASFVLILAGFLSLAGHWVGHL